MDTKFCQSCGMPLTEELKGTNADGSKNEDYCIYCYKDGAFTQDCSMEEMIDFCAQFVDEVNKNMPKPMTQEEYKQMMRQYFPMLKRWKPSKFIAEERNMRSWWKHNKKLMNAGELKPERVEMFKQLLELGERYKHVNQYH